MMGLLAGRYRLGDVLASGGSSVLHEASDMRLHRRVALKLMRPSRWDPQKTIRFREEAQTLAALRHPNLVTVFDAGETEDGTPFVVMELLEGQTLGEALDGQPRDPAWVLGWSLPLLGALRSAHDRGIIHRDIKPSNIFLQQAQGARRQTPILLEFGIAQRADPESEAGLNRGHVVGTPATMSPEQVHGEALTPATDIWSMAVVLYQALSGRLPFRASTSAELMSDIARLPPPSLAKIAPDVPAGLALAVDRALRPVQQRYSDVRAFARALLEAAVAEGIELPIDPDPVGLPRWSDWLNDATACGATADLTRVPPAPGRASFARASFMIMGVLVACGVAIALSLGGASVATKSATDFARGDEPEPKERPVVREASPSLVRVEEAQDPGTSAERSVVVASPPVRVAPRRVRAGALDRVDEQGPEDLVDPDGPFPDEITLPDILTSWDS